MADFNRGEQFTRFAAECYGNNVNFFQGDAHNPPLYPAHIAAVDPTDMGEIFLRNPPAFPLFFDVFAKECGQLIHSVYPDGQGDYCRYLEDLNATDYNPHFPLYP